MNEQNNTPLNVRMEYVKAQMIQAFNRVVADSQLPAYIIEGIVTGILADLRAQSNAELIAALTVNQEQADGNEAANTDEEDEGGN